MYQIQILAVVVVVIVVGAPYDDESWWRVINCQVRYLTTVCLDVVREADGSNMWEHVVGVNTVNDICTAVPPENILLQFIYIYIYMCPSREVGLWYISVTTRRINNEWEFSSSQRRREACLFWSKQRNVCTYRTICYIQYIHAFHGWLRPHFIVVYTKILLCLGLPVVDNECFDLEAIDNNFPCRNILTCTIYRPRLYDKEVASWYLRKCPVLVLG